MRFIGEIAVVLRQTQGVGDFLQSLSPENGRIWSFLMEL